VQLKGVRAMNMKSLRELFQRLPADGKALHELRSFNLGMMGGGVIPSAHQLAQRLGFDVYLVNLSKGQRGKLEVDTFAANGYRIEVNINDDVRTRRWTVLHEIMHFFLHPRNDPFAQPVFRAGREHFYDLHEGKEENEANAFVEALVFGDSALYAARSLHGNDLKVLADRFGVSVPTIQRALKKL
jgi:Zn-dependent peptidase ImmA (M78 family)